MMCLFFFVMKKYFFLLASFFYTPFVFADQTFFKGVIPAEGELGDKIKKGTVSLTDIPQVLVYVIDLVALLAGTIAVIALIYGGFQYMISGLVDDKQKAKTTIKWAIFGLLVTFSAWILVNLIQVQMTSA